MKPIFKLFYLENGLRYATSLVNPRSVLLTALPKSSVFHYTPEPDQDPTIDVTNPIYAGYNKKIALDCILEYSAIEGTVRRPMFNFPEMIRPFRRANRPKWDLLPHAWETDKNPETLHVINYGYLNSIYHYPEMPISKYYRWANYFRTIYTYMQKVASVSDRNQFIVMKAPSVLQSKVILDRYLDEEPSVRLAQLFGYEGFSGFNQLDLWRWINTKHRSKSLLSLIDPKYYGKINFVFQGQTENVVVVNMAYLDAWIKGQPNTTAINSLAQFDVVMIGKMFLKLQMTLNSLLVDVPDPAVSENVVVAETDEIDVPEEDAQETSDDQSASPPNQDDDVDDFNEDDSSNSESAFVAKPPVMEPKIGSFGKSKETKPIEQPPEPADTNQEILSSFVDDLDKDIQTLNTLSLRHLRDSGIKLKEDLEVIENTKTKEEVTADIYQSAPSTDRLLARLEDEAEYNLITAADYRKFKETVNKYKESKDPYGTPTTRAEAMVIRPADVEITPVETEIVVGSEVPDKTMAQSTLKEFDRQYVSKVFRKDVLRAIDSVQATGVAIRRHEIDTRHTALGTYETHQLELKPINGAPSVVQFTFPKIEADGTFMAGGNKYRLRTQRVD